MLLSQAKLLSFFRQEFVENSLCLFCYLFLVPGTDSAVLNLALGCVNILCFCTQVGRQRSGPHQPSSGQLKTLFFWVCLSIGGGKSRVPVLMVSILYFHASWIPLCLGAVVNSHVHFRISPAVIWQYEFVLIQGQHDESCLNLARQTGYSMALTHTGVYFYHCHWRFVVGCWWC